MKRLILPAALLIPLLAQHPANQLPEPERSSDVRLPNGKLQKDEILKHDHEKSVQDAAQLIDLAESLKRELEKDDTHVLSLSSLKKTEEIEKIAKRIRSRLKRF
ncbi:MAG: hypothetical protein LAP39_26785 [Acidobacteriia bacterium]|nr:hypothetical protein [Terriglobia bacterium]